MAKVTTEGVFTGYPIPTDGSYPYAIAAGPDGNLWFTEYRVSQVAKIPITATAVNEPPVVGPIAVTPGGVQPVNASLSFSAPFSDVNPADTHAALWDWGNGTSGRGRLLRAAVPAPCPARTATVHRECTRSR